MPMIVDSVEIPGTERVQNWLQTGLEVKPWKGARPRDATIDLMVLHWTAGEGSAGQVFRVLQGRSLGIEFIIDRQGDIVQCCDPIVTSGISIGRGRTFNPRQVGVEITNYGFIWPRGRSIPRKGRDRTTVWTKMKGMMLEMADFYPCQVEAALWLVDAVTSAIPTIPRVLPRELDGELAHRTLSRAEKRSFRGVCGHYHLSSRKLDPGPYLIDAVSRHLVVSNRYVQREPWSI